MDAFTNSATQDTLADLMDQLKLLTNQLQSIQLHKDEFEAKDVRVFPTLCRYCNGPHMSIDCQIKDPFAKVQPRQHPKEETLSVADMANTYTLYMDNAYT